jgi:hypothetical protein
MGMSKDDFRWDPHPEIIGAAIDGVRVFDEINQKEVSISEYAWKHGDTAARNKLAELRQAHSKGDTEAPQVGPKSSVSEPADSSISEKEAVPVEYKGNFLGGKKSVNDKLYNRTRESRSLQNPTTLLFYLIQHSAWDGKVDKHRTYRYWYEEKKLIVATRSQEQMARDLGVSIRTIQRWLDELEEDNLIQRTTEGRENIYVLGKVAGTHEIYFYQRARDEDFCKRKIGDNFDVYFR